ncbi:phosphohydrolase [candidate division KSB1 bacterium]|nr:MAG: phosphohydrolase [candidate division KSB1 bacterium]
MLDEKEKLQKIIDLSTEIAQVNDLDILLERILSLARNFVNADAGSIYIKENGKLKFSYAQNDTLSKKLPPGKKLIYTTFSLPIDNSTIAGYVANNDVTLNIPDVYQLKDDVPFHFGKKFDELTGYRTCSMLTTPLKTSTGVIVGVLQMINARDSDNRVVPFSKDDEPLVNYFASNAAIALERAQMTRTIILRMISMAELRDPKETGAHVNRVASYSVEIFEHWAKKKGMSDEEINKKRDVLRMAAMLHDVGKVAISDVILKKPARFTPEEYEIMKQHTFMGARLFSNPSSEFDIAAAEVALNHHERWDGKGYPGHINVLTGKPLPEYQDENGKPIGKKGNEIPLYGRIVAIADVYDALSSKRVYKEPWEQSQVLKIIKEEKGKQFDPDLVDSFFNCLDVIQSITAKYPE